MFSVFILFPLFAQSIPDNIRQYCTVGENLDIIVRYRILVCTCVTSGLLYSLGLKTGHFTHVFVDEVGTKFYFYFLYI